MSQPDTTTHRPAFVDAHVHLYDLDTQHHGWLSQGWSDAQAAYLGDYSPLIRNYLIDDLIGDMTGHDVIKTVHIQADWTGDQVDETRWLQSIADVHRFPQAIVAHTDLRRPDAAAELDAHCAHPNVRGVRMLAYVMPGGGLFADRDFRRGFRALAARELSFDLGTGPDEMHHAIDLAAAFPETQFVLGHAGMPLDRSSDALERWRRGLRRLAEAPHVAVKVSGLGMGDHRWTVETLRPLVLETIEIFGVERSLLASNWPIDSLYSSYGDLVRAYEQVTAEFSPSEQYALWRGNAERVYRI